MKKKGTRWLLSVLLAVFLISGLVTGYAWFTAKRKLATITRLNAPSELVIGAGAKESSLNINIGGIDAEDEAQKKDFVFCVYSDESVENYKLQIAHTTNIDFVYTIYKAEEQDGGSAESTEYIDGSGVSHYYVKNGGAITGKYLNQNGKIADKSLHKSSYDSYSKVQKNAEPLYWQTDDVIQPTNNSGSGFLDYYILEISWDDSVSNNKETDMVYLTAGMVQ